MQSTPAGWIWWLRTAQLVWIKGLVEDLFKGDRKLVRFFARWNYQFLHCDARKFCFSEKLEAEYWFWFLSEQKASCSTCHHSTSRSSGRSCLLCEFLFRTRCERAPGLCSCLVFCLYLPTRTLSKALLSWCIWNAKCTSLRVQVRLFRCVSTRVRGVGVRFWQNRGNSDHLDRISRNHTHQLWSHSRTKLNLCCRHGRALQGNRHSAKCCVLNDQLNASSHGRARLGQARVQCLQIDHATHQWT